MWEIGFEEVLASQQDVLCRDIRGGDRGYRGMQRRKEGRNEGRKEGRTDVIRVGVMVNGGILLSQAKTARHQM